MFQKHKNLFIFAIIGLMILIVFNWETVKSYATGKPKAIADPSQGNILKNILAGGKTPTSTGSGTNSKGVTSSVNGNTVITKGSEGPEVAAVQQMMLDGWGRGYLPTYGADGKFGNETATALKSITGGQTSTTVFTFQNNYYNPRKYANPSNTQAWAFGIGL